MKEKEANQNEEFLDQVEVIFEPEDDLEFLDELDDIEEIEELDIEEQKEPKQEKDRLDLPAGLSSITVEENQKPLRIDKYLSDHLSLSRVRIRELLEEKKILVKSKPVKNSYKVQPGDIITIDLPENKPLELEAQPMDLDIVYEDEDLLVINKPKGLVVHPAPGHYSDTLVNGLLAHCTNLSGINGILRPGIVHRIDKDTSGLLVVAKNDLAHRALARQLEEKSCYREYLAIVHKPFPHNHGTIDAPIGRDPKNRQNMAVTEIHSKEAITHFDVLENFKDYALLSCRLETGRTHQIRVHMAFIGHPVAGDPKYGPRQSLEAHGQLLHAHKLSFIHPRTNQRMEFEAGPDETFEQILEQLRKEQA